MVRLQHDTNDQFKITLPKALVDAKGWKKGDLLKIVLDDVGNLVIKKEGKK